jgi:hypothetical protein
MQILPLNIAAAVKLYLSEEHADLYRLTTVVVKLLRDAYPIGTYCENEAHKR